jgi:diguanylate cyclase (GGDEF)-like protein
MPGSTDILNASVLIVDDQEADVYLLKNMLAEAGYTSVASTMNPREACELHRKHGYDLILLDLQMPGMSGFEVLAELKKIEPQSYLSVLVVSGEPASKMRALQSGAKDFVSKPFDPIEVLTRIHNLLEVRLLYKEAERQLLHLAHHDPLTGLPNRKLFYELLGRALVQAAEHHWTVSVLVLDIDRFKNINDTLGHAMGDELLRQCSNRLRNCLRFNDTIARLGGDEFGLILLTAKIPDESSIVASKIREALRQPFDLNGHEVTVTVSIGITLYPLDALDVSSLVQNGDTAMYRAKEAGRNTYRFYTPQMNHRAIEKLDTEGALRKALERDEFMLHYQPKVNLATGRITGVEALLRWNRPGHGLVPPLDFIPILEETGLIIAVGNWVIQTACRQIAQWQRTEVGSVCIAVNLSTRQLSHESVNGETHRSMEQYAIDPQLLEFEVETVGAVRDNGIDAALLEFELTESLLMSHAHKSVAILQRLKNLGIRLSMDDFGTGFSSLAYLKRFPIDTLKIDRAFIRDVTANADDAAITLAIIAMAHNLKLKVIAEGVETVAQLQFLRDHDCDEAQGYYLSRPLPEMQISKLLRQGVIVIGGVDASQPPATSGTSISIVHSKPSAG